MQDTIMVSGRPTQKIQPVSVDTPNVRAQRKIYTTKAESYLQEVGEFDWNLFGAILVVEYPDGTQEIVDGGHRTWLVKQYLPEVQSVPAIILKVNDEAEAAQIFHRINGTCSKSVNNEEKFVAQVLGKEKGALKLEQGLKMCNARVQSNGNVVGLKRGKTIRIAKWRTLYTRNAAITEKACGILNDVFANDDHYNVLLLEGLITLIDFMEKQSFDFNRYENDFVAFLEDKSKITEQNKMTYGQLRKDNHYGISVAYGLYQDFYYWCKINNKKAPFAIKVIGEVYAKAGQQDD